MAPAGAQWELLEGVARETGAILSLSRCGRGILTRPLDGHSGPAGAFHALLPAAARRQSWLLKACEGLIDFADTYVGAGRASDGNRMRP